MAKYIKKKALKNAIDCCTWYHINKNGELVEGANSSEHEPLYKYSDIKKIIKGLPTRKFEDVPQMETEIAKAIVHKMIDDAVIAEDAYPDLRQKMHDAVDEYEPRTDCQWK